MRVGATDAINNPSVSSRAHETVNVDFPSRAVDAIEVDSLAQLKPDIITCTEKLSEYDYFAELAFMEEKIELYLHPGRDKNSPQFVDFSIGGRTVWVQVGKLTRMARKYVEVMARSQPVDVRTRSHKIEDSPEALCVNDAVRTTFPNYAFSVTHDPSPIGGAWLARVMRES